MSEVYTPVHRISALEDVQAQLVRLIIEGRVRSNDRLPPERELARLLGVGRTTLREALRGLVDRGMIESRPGAGWYVKRSEDTVVQNLVLHFRLEDITIEQTSEVRQLLEPYGARLAAERRTEDDIEALRTHLQQMAEALERTTFLTADTQFHESLARATHNPFFSMALKPILLVLFETRASVLARAKDMQTLTRQHRKVFDAVAARDGDAADTAMRRHLAAML